MPIDTTNIPAPPASEETPMHRWPDGQVRQEAPYRCGAFDTKSMDVCTKLSDHDGPHVFGPFIRPPAPPLDAGGATDAKIGAALRAWHAAESPYLSIADAVRTQGFDAIIKMIEGAPPSPEGTGTLDPKRSLTCNQCRRFVCSSEFDRIVYCDATCESAWKREHGWPDDSAGDLPGVGPEGEVLKALREIRSDNGWAHTTLLNEINRLSAIVSEAYAEVARLRLHAAAAEQITPRHLEIVQNFATAHESRFDGPDRSALRDVADVLAAPLAQRTP